MSEHVCADCGAAMGMMDIHVCGIEAGTMVIGGVEDLRALRAEIDRLRITNAELAGEVAHQRERADVAIGHENADHAQIKALTTEVEKLTEHGRILCKDAKESSERTLQRLLAATGLPVTGWMDDVLAQIAALRAPIPMLLWCPECGSRHVDAGEFATKPHHTHACQRCGHVWRPSIMATVGVQYLPGFKDTP